MTNLRKLPEKAQLLRLRYPIIEPPTNISTSELLGENDIPIITYHRQMPLSLPKKTSPRSKKLNNNNSLNKQIELDRYIAAKRKLYLQKAKSQKEKNSFSSRTGRKKKPPIPTFNTARAKSRPTKTTSSKTKTKLNVNDATKTSQNSQNESKDNNNHEMGGEKSKKKVARVRFVPPAEPQPCFPSLSTLNRRGAVHEDEAEATELEKRSSFFEELKQSQQQGAVSEESSVQDDASLEQMPTQFSRLTPINPINEQAIEISTPTLDKNLQAHRRSYSSLLSKALVTTSQAERDLTEPGHDHSSQAITTVGPDNDERSLAEPEHKALTSALQGANTNETELRQVKVPVVYPLEAPEGRSYPHHNDGGSISAWQDRSYNSSQNKRIIDISMLSGTNMGVIKEEPQVQQPKLRNSRSSSTVFRVKEPLRSQPQRVVCSPRLVKPSGFRVPSRPKSARLSRFSPRYRPPGFAADGTPLYDSPAPRAAFMMSYQPAQPATKTRMNPPSAHQHQKKEAGSEQVIDTCRLSFLQTVAASAKDWTANTAPTGPSDPALALKQSLSPRTRKDHKSRDDAKDKHIADPSLSEEILKVPGITIKRPEAIPIEPPPPLPPAYRLDPGPSPSARAIANWHPSRPFNAGASHNSSSGGESQLIPDPLPIFNTGVLSVAKPPETKRRAMGNKNFTLLEELPEEKATDAKTELWTMSFT